MFAAGKAVSGAEATDAQFPYVTMLLHGDGTNGAQNNTFLDSSTNNFTITRNGNTTQGTFTPYGSNWSNYFDGTGDYLTVPDNAVLDMGSSDFTIEGWVFLSSTGSSQTFVAKGTGAGNQASYHIVFNGTNWLYYLSGNGSTWSIASGVTMGAGTANTWQHLALVRSGSTFTPYVNGTAGTTTSSATALFDSTNVFSIGADDAANQRITGYISNCRVVKGTAVYTSAFTPSTTPLTAITNTQLLTCQSNRFIDNSSNAFTVTKAGDVSVQRFNPFGASTAYDTSVIGGSGYFDGTGDYLTAGTNAAFAVGTGDFTIEFWVYPTAFSGTYSGYFTTRVGGQGFDIQILNSSATLMLGNNLGAVISANNVVSLNNWQHICAVRSGSTNSLYVNGTRVATGTDSTNFTDNGAKVFSSGPSGGNNGVGFMTDVRLVKGTAVYSPSSSTLTVPTAPLTAITNTSLLLSYTNAGILDNAMMNDLETVGNAQISTSVKKYGTGSMYFDGTGDYLTVPASPNFIFGTGDFTVEFWVQEVTSWNPAGGSNYAHWISLNSYTTGIMIRPNLTGTAVEVWVGNTQYSFTTTLSLGTWYHIAVSRSSSSMRFFVNGTQIGTTQTVTYNISTNTANTIGSAVHSTTEVMQGYIDDLRISKVARYTANFTAPTTAFADKG